MFPSFLFFPPTEVGVYSPEPKTAGRESEKGKTRRFAAGKYDMPAQDPKKQNTRQLTRLICFV